MTKKDYKLIAKAINESVKNTRILMLGNGDNDNLAYTEQMLALNSVIEKIGIVLDKDNSRFDFDKFKDACLID
jgi:hypothetical protein